MQYRAITQRHLGVFAPAQLTEPTEKIPHALFGLGGGGGEGGAGAGI